MKYPCVRFLQGYRRRTAQFAHLHKCCENLALSTATVIFSINIITIYYKIVDVTPSITRMGHKNILGLCIDSNEGTKFWDTIPDLTHAWDSALVILEIWNPAKV